MENSLLKSKQDSETEAGTLMVEAIEPPKGNNLSIWEDDPSERKKNQSNRDIVNQEMISNQLIMIPFMKIISFRSKNLENRLKRVIEGISKSKSKDSVDFYGF